VRRDVHRSIRTALGARNHASCVKWPAMATQGAGRGIRTGYGPPHRLISDTSFATTSATAAGAAARNACAATAASCRQEGSLFWFTSQRQDRKYASQFRSETTATATMAATPRSIIGDAPDWPLPPESRPLCVLPCKRCTPACNSYEFPARMARGTGRSIRIVPGRAPIRPAPSRCEAGQSYMHKAPGGQGPRKTRGPSARIGSVRSAG